MSTITKRQIASRITDHLGEQGRKVTHKFVMEIIECYVEEMSEALARGESVVMRNFGTLEVREVKAKIGRNPKNPTETVHIPARAAVRFKPGRELKEKVATTLPLIREQKS